MSTAKSWTGPFQPDDSGSLKMKDVAFKVAIALLIVGSTSLFLILPSIFMARTIWKLDLESRHVSWRWKELEVVSFNVPVVKRVRETHKERASRRLDNRTDWRVMAGVSICTR